MIEDRDGQAEGKHSGVMHAPDTASHREGSAQEPHRAGKTTVRRDPASQVEVRFYAESPTTTRVELEHRHIDRHGPGWEAITDGVDGAQGWPLYLDRYTALVKEDS